MFATVRIVLYGYNSTVQYVQYFKVPYERYVVCTCSVPSTCNTYDSYPVRTVHRTIPTVPVPGATL